MSAQAVFNSGLALPENLASSFKEGAATFVNANLIKTAPSQTPQLHLVEATNALYVAKPWVPSEPSISSKGSMLGIVALAHVLFAFALSMMYKPETQVEVKPLQVALIAAPESEVDVPPLPKSIPQPILTLPVEPVYIDIAEPETAITVAARATETMALSVTPTGTPKTVSSVEYVREPQAKRSAAARALKQHGTVTIRVLIDAQGHASEVTVHRSSGYRALDDAARKAVLDALFKPYMENGQPQPVYALVPIEFEAA